MTDHFSPAVPINFSIEKILRSESTVTIQKLYNKKLQNLVKTEKWNDVINIDRNPQVAYDIFINKLNNYIKVFTKIGSKYKKTFKV